MDGRTLTIKEAAEHLGVSERTIRRRMAAGEFRTSKVPTPHGEKVLIHLDTAPAVTPDIRGDVTPDTQHVATDAAGYTGSVRGDIHAPVTHDVTPDSAPDTPDSAALLKALALVEQQQYTIDQLGSLNVQLAGQVGFLQAKLQDAEERIKLLTDAQHGTAQAATSDPASDPATEPAAPKGWRGLVRRFFMPR